MSSLTHDGLWNPHEIVFSEVEDIMFNFEGNLVKKKDSFQTMVLGIGSSERMEIEVVTR